MTTPSYNLEEIVPLKYKPIVAWVGSTLTFLVPEGLKLAAHLPAPWPLVIGLVIAVLTGLGVYRAPYKPQGTMLAPATPAVAAAAAQSVAPTPVVNPDTGGPYENPWQKRQP